MKRILLAIAFAAIPLSAAFATPSTQIWIPSTDIQAEGKSHYGLDVYVPVEQAEGGGWIAPLVVQGLTYGVFSNEKIAVEAGVDLKSLGNDSHPLYFNAKVGVPEGALFEGAPAFAVGGYDFGQTEETGYNLVYGLVAKTIGPLGRFSLGYFQGDEDLLGEDDAGLLASWDRTLTEISPKLWAAADYQEGKSGYGSLNFGVAWSFAENVSVIFGYDLYDGDLPSTGTVQVDINF